MASPHVTVTSSDGTTLAWADGVTLSVVQVRQAVTADVGPGSIPGRPETVVSLQVSNGSNRAIDLFQVLVSMPYDTAPPRLAAHVYDEGTYEFAALVPPGGSAQATYGFAVPAGRSADLTVDLDGNHTIGTLQGVAG
ncbi:MAG: hypothetical protein ACRYG2_37200 [Janthinobacterium lividum]